MDSFEKDFIKHCKENNIEEIESLEEDFIQHLKDNNINDIKEFEQDFIKHVEEEKINKAQNDFYARTRTKYDDTNLKSHKYKTYTMNFGVEETPLNAIGHLVKDFFNKVI